MLSTVLTTSTSIFTPSAVSLIAIAAFSAFRQNFAEATTDYSIPFVEEDGNRLCGDKSNDNTWFGWLSNVMDCTMLKGNFGSPNIDIFSVVESIYNKPKATVLEEIKKFQNKFYFVKKYINWSDSNGYLPLAAIFKRKLNDKYAIAQALIDLGAHPDTVQEFGDVTPTVLALAHKENKILKLFLKHGANPNQKLSYWAFYPNLEACKELYGKSLLEAAQIMNPEAVSLLQAFGAKGRVVKVVTTESTETAPNVLNQFSYNSSMPLRTALINSSNDIKASKKSP